MLVVRAVNLCLNGSRCRIFPKLSGWSSRVPAAPLMATRGEPRDRPRSFPYKERKYNAFWQFFDKTTKRMDENSVLIVVEGSLSTGKKEFARRLAREFDLLYVPDVRFGEQFIYPGTGFDLRELDEQLSPHLRTYDLKDFYTDPNPQSLRIGIQQLCMYQLRFFRYVEALDHLLNTGQGVVMERSVFSDLVFVETLTKLNYMTKEGNKYYVDILRKNTICELWKPHLFIYLDAPVTYIREKINKRAIPYEVNSKVLSDEYLQTIEDMYKQKFLPSMSLSCPTNAHAQMKRPHSEILEYNVTDMPDWDIIIEDLEELQLEEPIDDDDEIKFKSWKLKREDDWNNYRMVVSTRNKLERMFTLPSPWEAPELMIHGDDFLEYEKIVLQNPEIKYAKGFNPYKDKNLFLKL